MLDLTLRVAARFFTRTATRRSPPTTKPIAPGLTLAAALGLSLMHDAGAAPIPFFPDPALQTCVTELAAANGWSSAEQVTYVDCSDRGIRDLQGMEGLSALQAARLGRNAVYDPYPLQGLTQLTALDLSENRLINITALGTLTTLSELDLADNPWLDITQIQPVIANNPGLSDLSLAGIAINSLWELPLSNGQGGYLPLKHLNLSRTGLVDLFGIENLATLETLELAGNRFDFIDPIGALSGLKSLDLSDNALHDTFGLGPLSGLTLLDLSDNPGLDPIEINNILAPNTGLQVLRLNGIRIEDINQLVLWDPVKGAPYALRELGLNRSGLISTQPLAGFPTLEYLDLSDNEFLDVVALSDLNALTHVDLSRNALHDVMPLSLLDKLVTLRLSGNHGLDVVQVESVIAANTALQEIALGDIFIGDLGRLPLTDPLTGQPYALHTLDLSNTGIGDIWRLSDFAGLRQVNLSANHLFDVLPLDLLDGLRAVDLHDNDIEFIDFVYNLPQLSELDLSGNLIRDVSALTTLQNLRSLRLSDNPRLALDATLQSVLQNNAGLKRLALSGMAIDPLWPLPLIDTVSGKPYALVELQLRATGLRDIYPLIDFPTLQRLDLAANHIEQADVLGNLQNLRELNLSDNALTNTLGLDTLHALRSLDVSGNKRLDTGQINAVLAGNPRLRELALADIALEDLYQLLLSDPFTGKPYALTALNVRNTGLVDINRLFEFPELQSLDASQNRIHNLIGLDYLFGLRALDLSDNEIIDVAPLGNQFKLHTLRLSGNAGIDVQQLQPVLANNTSLRALGLGGIFIGDLNALNLFDPLTGKPYDLLELDVGDTGIGDVWRVAEFPGLKRLDISHNSVFDINPLQALMAPEALDLSYNDIDNLGALSNQHNLRRLDLSGNRALTLDPVLSDLLSRNVRLTHLGLGGIPVEFFAQLPLFDTTNLPLPLISLDVSDTGLRDLYGAEIIPTLQVLMASDNRIEDIANLAFPFDPLTLRELDLSGNALNDISALNNYSGLTAWDVSANAGITLAQIQTVLANNNGLTRIGLGDIAVGDLYQLPLTHPLTGMPYELVELNLHNTGIGDVRRLSDFTDLAVLDLSQNRVLDITPLNSLQALQVLDLSDNELADVSALGNHTALRTLRLSDNPGIELFQVQPILANNTGLRVLGLGGIHIGSLDVLELTDPATATPYKLIELDVSNTGIGDIFRIADFPGLKRLDISHNTVFDIIPLQSLAAPEALDLSYNGIDNVAVLTGFNRLTRLDLSGNAGVLLDATLIGILQQNKGLTHLGLGGIPVEFFAQLPLFDSTFKPLPLLSLDVSDTGLRDLYGVEAIPTLQTLKASGNRIEDIANLAFPADPFTLRELDLSGNALSDVSALNNYQGLKAWDVSANTGITLLQIQPVLANNTGLTRIGLGDIAIGDLYQLPLNDPATHVPYKLVELDLRNTGIGDVWRLSEFTGLTVLNLSHNQIADIAPIGGLVALERLDLSYNSFSLVNALFGLARLVDLKLLGNTQILCADLDALEAALGGAVVTRPASCTP